MGVLELNDIPTLDKSLSIDIRLSSDCKDKQNDLENLLLESLSLIRDDITTLKVDAIVNASNVDLLAGGGVCGSIFKKAGYSQLTKACSKLRCKEGDAVITSGFNLPSKFIIHSTGPKGLNPNSLTSCYNSSLNLLVEQGLTSIVFPCISTGIYGYPNLDAAKIAFKTCLEFLTDYYSFRDETEPNLRVIFATFLDKDYQIYKKLIEARFLSKRLGEKV